MFILSTPFYNHYLFHFFYAIVMFCVVFVVGIILESNPQKYTNYTLSPQPDGKNLTMAWIDYKKAFDMVSA